MTDHQKIKAYTLGLIQKNLGPGEVSFVCSMIQIASREPRRFLTEKQINWLDGLFDQYRPQIIESLFQNTRTAPAFQSRKES